MSTQMNPETLQWWRDNPFAWPGGYAVVGTMDDGGLLCHGCGTEAYVHVGGDADGWRLEAVGPYWEGPTVPCAHCGGEIESEYGDPEEQG